MEALILWLRRHKEKKVLTLFRSRWFDYILFAAGALIVLSPLPDELGLALMGVSQIRNVLFFPVSFALNFFSILILGLAARSLF